MMHFTIQLTEHPKVIYLDNLPSQHSLIGQILQLGKTFNLIYTFSSPNYSYANPALCSCPGANYMIQPSDYNNSAGTFNHLGTTTDRKCCCEVGGSGNFACPSGLESSVSGTEFYRSDNVRADISGGPNCNSSAS